MKKRGKVKKVSEIWRFNGFGPFRESYCAFFPICECFFAVSGSRSKAVTAR
jgi:hypothetical protein